jgi:hypothetical protein
MKTLIREAAERRAADALWCGSNCGIAGEPGRPSHGNSIQKPLIEPDRPLEVNSTRKHLTILPTKTLKVSLNSNHELFTSKLLNPKTTSNQSASKPQASHKPQKRDFVEIIMISDDDDDPWTCKTCTEVNQAVVLQCTFCLQTRPY